ncbi:MAG: hypothetical protein J5808_02355 [Paludibacteraceae bacterium]|nr:hypothetical protein [Paludibacteraceae bacterium]
MSLGSNRPCVPASVLMLLTLAAFGLLWLPAYWGIPAPGHIPLDWSSYWYAMLHTVWNPTNVVATTLSWMLPLLCGVLIFFVNRLHQVIRTESWFPIFFLLFTIGLVWTGHMMSPGIYASTFVVISLIRFIDARDPVWAAFDVHFFLSAGSLFSFEVIWYCPIFFIFLINERRFNFRMIWSSLFGVLIPYLLTIGIAILTDTLPLFFQMMVNVWHSFGWYPITDGMVWAQFGLILALSFWCAWHFIRNYTKDKNKSRSYMTFVYCTLLFSTIISFFYPAPLLQGAPVICALASTVFSHYFANARGRLPKIIFALAVSSMSAVYIFHYLW